MATPSKVHKYNLGEVDLDELSIKAEAIFNKKPFQWQLTISKVVLQGEGIIVDVGTGCGQRDVIWACPERCPRIEVVPS